MKKSAFYILAVIVLFSVSCEKWLDVNDDPNSIREIDYEELLAPGISSVAYVVGGRYQVLGALWSQHWTQSPGASQYAGIDSYDINSSTYDGQFGELYSGALKNLEEVRVQSAQEKEWKYCLIATVMQVYTFQILTDLYNQVPFSEALYGNEDIKNPKWEQGDDIYDSLIARLDAVLEYDYDDEDLSNPEKRDLIFNGDIDLWIAFANTLKLKIYLRQSEVNPSIAKAGIEKLYQDEVEFLDASAGMIQFSNESGRRNPLYETEFNVFGQNPNLVLSRTLHSLLEENGDFNRLDAMFSTPSNGGGHKSLPQGDYNPSDEPSGISSSSYSKPVLIPNAPVYLMSSMESYLLQAEAIMRYEVDDYDNAKQKYEDAITISFLRLLYDGTNGEFVQNLAQTFYQSGDSRFPAESSALEQFVEVIITQKWVALAGIQSLETFFEHNRTKYPRISKVDANDEDYTAGEFTVSVNNVTSGRFPKRLIFPESEISSNDNVPKKKEVWEAVWWDVKVVAD
ncbi:MAG: SusD/RagB family nutrient-binding outer membrane lipoprotein [Bacteroidales bacterium]|nr:SusD/RagB family nutrient-binding outer membrane lipoprotein [Bacteroidales bacterium]